VTDPVRVATALVAYIEPHAGYERAFNAWYERDHFYASAMAGPGMYAGARWVATRDCKALRPDARLFGDPARGSYLTTCWLLPGAQDAWDEWAAEEYQRLPADRRFEHRDHLHTGVYESVFTTAADGAPVAATALDHGFPGVIAVAVAAAGATSAADALAAWAERVVGASLPLVLGFTAARTIMTSTDPGAHALAFAFCAVDPRDVWQHLALPDDVGFASAFLRTIPGTDTYTDEL
jgi:hypothetical protein